MTTPVVHVFVQIARDDPRLGSANYMYAAKPRHLSRFCGSLTNPNSIAPLPSQPANQACVVKEEQNDVPPLRAFEPVVTFSSREPVAAQSRATLLYDNHDGSPLAPRSQTHTEPLVASTASSSSTSSSVSESHSASQIMGDMYGMANGAGLSPSAYVSPSSANLGSSGSDDYEDDRANFVYSTNIATAETWAMLCNDAGA
jgi:hypothetical protein